MFKCSPGVQGFHPQPCLVSYFIFRQNDKEETNDKIHIFMPNIWPDLLAFGLKKSIIGDEDWFGMWISDPKNCLVLVLPELVVRRGQDLKRWFLLAGCICKLVLGKATPWKSWCLFAENHFFLFFQRWCLGRCRGWKVIFACCLPKIVFFSIFLSSRCLGRGRCWQVIFARR